MNRPLTIGNFDGVHLGHQALLKRMRAIGGELSLLTFSNHPCQVVRGFTPPRLIGETHKHNILKSLGISNLVTIPFTKELSLKSARDFLTSLPLSFTHLILGHDATLGCNREGDAKTLGHLAAELGFTLEYHPPISAHGQTISSSRIRTLVESGDLEGASALLGRAYTIFGPVIPGAGVGRLLGFETANLAVKGLALPPFGVYACSLEIEGTSHRGIANLGKAPTLHESRPPLLEVHILDCNISSLYGRELEVTLRHFLRHERKFSSHEELKEQIARDLSFIKN